MRGESQSPPRAATAEEGFGSTPRVPKTGFLVFGLLSFWTYTALRLAFLVRAHRRQRWREFSARIAAADLPAERVEGWRARGFGAGIAIPLVAATLFATSEIIILVWIFGWSVIQETDVGAIIPRIAAAAALFYVATLALVLWTVTSLRVHELAELVLLERGPHADHSRVVPSDALAARWEDLQNRATLFLVVACAMVGAPVVAASLFVSGYTSAYAGLPALACMIIGGGFHVWGTRLLLGMFNSHLAVEVEYGAAAAGARSAAGTASSERQLATSEVARADPFQPYAGREGFVFISYKREDLERVRPLLLRLHRSGYRLWYDKGIPGGAEWDALTEEKLRACAVLLFFVSRASVQSKHCRREVKYADQLDKPILSVRLEPAPLAHGLEMLLTQYQIIEANAPDLEEQLARGLEFIGAGAGSNGRVS